MLVELVGAPLVKLFAEVVCVYHLVKRKKHETKYEEQSKVIYQTYSASVDAQGKTKFHLMHQCQNVSERNQADIKRNED